MNSGIAQRRVSWRLSWFLSGFLFAVVGADTFAQGTLSVIRTNGPTSNRLNIVIFSEGYQTNQLAKFLIDATNTVNSMLTTMPYSEYSNYFNAFAISVASVDSGSDHDTPTTNRVNTYFNSTYDSYGIQRLIMIPPNDRDFDSANGVRKIDNLLQAFMPEYDIIFLIVNDPQYGGSGGFALISSVEDSAPEIMVHESGHGFGGLADEYSDPYPGSYPVEYPNATSSTNRGSIKWTSWISVTTPIPTPATTPYLDVVGLFLGAEYQTNGWYRPKYNCKMNHLGVPFCEVCSEQLVKSIYQRLNSVDSLSPASTNISIVQTQAMTFSVTLLHPVTHNLNVQWFTNGVAVNSGTNSSFTLAPLTFSSGTNTVTAGVRDLTTLVREDIRNVLSNSITWNVVVNPAQLHLVGAQWLTGGKFTFRVTGAAPNGFVVQGSTNLVNWVPLATNFLVGGQFNYTNSGAEAFPRRFFRATVAP